MKRVVLVGAMLPLVFLASRVAADDPEISRSAGESGGVVILWPRVIPRTETAPSRELARSIQKRLEELAGNVLPGRPVEVRPEPERVCRRAGCVALSLGALLARSGKGCAVVALISRPGPSPARLVPCAGKVRLKREWVPFREPPESHLAIKDFARCDKVLDEMSGCEGAIQGAIHQAVSPKPAGSPKKSQEK